jgi:hypothetical protein
MTAYARLWHNKTNEDYKFQFSHFLSDSMSTSQLLFQNACELLVNGQLQ